MAANETPTGACRLMRLREVMQLCGLSRATLYREVKRHAFPAPVKLSARSVAWLQDDVMKWINERVAQRGPAYHTGSHDPGNAGISVVAIPDPRQARDESE
jgi:predicted DNA-binding transcriptional regulator AlpA